MTGTKTAPRGRMRGGDMLIGAERIRAEASLARSLGGLSMADDWEARARSLVEAPERGSGGELLPSDAFGIDRTLRNTLDNPDYVAADASRDRLQLAHDAGVLELAADTADTIQAENSVERMLAHQLASAHHSTMSLSQQLNSCPERLQDAGHEPSREAANVQATRLAGAIARMMGAYQSGALTMHRLKTGGRQHMTVKHLHVTKVEDGGQAIVAGEMKVGTGSKNRRRSDVR